MEKLGLVEKIKIIGEKTVEAEAKIDTGAKRSSLDYRLAANARLGPVVSSVKVLTSGKKGHRYYIRRPIVEAKIQVNDKVFKTRVSLEDREHMQFPVIIGRDLLKNFVVEIGDGYAK